MSSEHVDVITPIKKWLDANHEKICSFWIGADWRGWARFEIFVALEKALGDCLVTHSNDDFWTDSTDLVDVLIEPRDDKLNSVAIILRCERVNENEGSFERFADEFNKDWEDINNKGKAQNDFEGTKLLLLGFSGEAMGDGPENFTIEPKPSTFNSGEVYGWFKEYNVSV